MMNEQHGLCLKTGCRVAVAQRSDATDCRSSGGSLRSTPATHSENLSLQTKPSRRTGAVLMVVLTCLAVVAIVATGLVRLGGHNRDQQRQRQRSLQAVWLAESGVSRAVARLAADALYKGETWNVGADELGGRDSAVVVIRIEKVEERPALRVVHVVADVAPAPGRRARHSKQISLQIEQSTSAEVIVP